MFSEGINSRSLVYHSENAGEAPVSSVEIKFNQHLERIEAEVAACHSKIIPKVFANRMIPAYLKKTEIEATYSLHSAKHWLWLLSLWLEDKAVFLPHKISKAHLKIVQEKLQKYANTIERIEGIGLETCRGTAKEIIAEIQRELKVGKTFYTYLGYSATERDKKGGHALTVKFSNQGDNIEVSFLNLGAGLHMHPHVDWGFEGSRHHFQSFPVVISKVTFASPECEDVFTRLVQLKVKMCPLGMQKYSSEDVYGPLYSLGTVQSSFNTNIADRSRKPQLNGICADMAVLLLIKDLLIDLGYTRDEIHRFITLEKLCNTLFFHHQLRQSGGTLDEWILLRNGLREFSIRALKDNETILSKTEIEFLHHLLQPIFGETFKKIDQLKRVVLPLTPLQKVLEPTANIFQKKNDIPEGVLVELFISENKIGSSVGTPSLLSVDPTEIRTQLLSWVKIAEALVNGDNAKKAHHFVYRALCSLEIPHPDGMGFWSQVPLDEIVEIVHALALLTQLGVDRSEKALIYRNVLILATGYIISDVLVRQKYPQLFKGFASPFDFLKMRLTYKENYLYRKGWSELIPQEQMYAFWMLPIGVLNERWQQIQYYFEKQQSISSHTLFGGPDKRINIHKVLKGTQDFIVESSWSPVREHLKFLEYFREQAFPGSTLSLYEQYQELWMNENNRYIPVEIETLYFFAYHTRLSIYCNLPPSTDIPPRIRRMSSEDGCIITERRPIHRHGREVDIYLGKKPWYADLWVKQRNVIAMTENQTQCALDKCWNMGRTWNIQLYRQWLRIFSEHSLQISSLIQWMENNFSLLSEVEIQQNIEFALFAPGLLKNKIQEEPSILPQLRELVRDAIVYYTNSSIDHSTVLFLLRLGITIESFAPDPSLEALEVYETLLLKYAEFSKWCAYYVHLLLLYQVALPRGEDSLRQLIKAQVWLKYHELQSRSEEQQLREWILIEIEFPLERHHIALSECFKNSNWKEQIFNEVFTLILGENILPIGSCKGTYPIISKGEYSIHVEEGTIFRDSAQLIYLNSYHQQYFPSIKKANGLYWSTGKQLISESGLCLIEKTEKKGRLGKKFPHLEDPYLRDKWFYKIALHQDFFSGFALADKSSYDHWAYSESTEWSHIVICKNGESHPLYLVYNKQDHLEVFKILPSGKCGPTLVNTLEKEGPLRTWFTRLGDNKEVCVWMNSETRQIEEMEFLRLGLTFKQERGHFYCQNFPDFALAEDQTLEELGFFEGALVLEDGKQKMILVPARYLKRDDKNFSTHVFLGEGTPSKEKFFCYQFDAIAGVLTHPTAEANLFLAFLFAAQRNYTQALFYLGRAHAYTPYHQNCQWLVDAFLELKDHSPEALVFHLKFGLHMIHHTQQILNSKYGEKYQILSIQFVTKLTKKFIQYLRIHSCKEISRVPKENQLTHEEELFLLQTLKKILKEEGAKTEIGKGIASLWKEVLNMRLSLLQGKKWSAVITPHPYPLLFTKVVNLSDFSLMEVFKYHPPSCLKPSAPLPEFVRLKGEDLRENFITLYERACRGEATLDLFYLMRNTYAFGYCETYCLVLQYVQRHPDEFKTLNFGDDERENRRVAEKIFVSVGGIYKRIKETASDITNFLLNDVVFFRYQKSITLTVTPHPILVHPAWALPKNEIKNLQDLRTSLSLYFQETWFDASQEPILNETTPFAFAEMQKHVTQNSPLHLELQHLHSGYKQLQYPRNGKTIFRLKNGKTTKECLLEAKQWLEAKHTEIHRIKDLTESIANYYPQHLHPFGLRKMSRNLPWITLEGILTLAYLNQSTLMIKEANPSLTMSQIQELIYLIVQYHILRSQIFQLERGIEALEKKGSVEGCAEALACYGTFNPVENPEIFLYQSRTGKTLRKSQAELLEWELASTEKMSFKVRLFCAPAGDGKTTLYIPIAMKRFQRKGYVPISISSEPLYLVDREGLKETAKHTVDLGIDVIELFLNTATKATDFEWIYEQLSQYGSKRGFKLTPKTYYALHLKYQLALDSGDKLSVYWIGEIFNFLASKGAALGDECRLNWSPFTQAKMGIGKPISIPEEDGKLFLEIYRAFVSEKILLPNHKSVKETVGLDKNQQAMMSDLERKQVKEAVCMTLAQHRLFEIPPAQRPSIVDYWLGCAKESDWLKSKVGLSQGRAIDVVKIYFEEFFNKVMRLIGKMQHVRSIRPGEEIHVPARARQATLAYFEEVYLTLIATIHGLLQEGLNKEQVKKMLVRLEQKVIKEVGTSGKISETERMLGEWAGKKEIVLNPAAIPHLVQDSAFYSQVHKNTEAIFWYLEQIILPQISLSPQQFSVSPIYFQNAFNHITLFSADPGPQEIYGIFTSGQNVRTHPLFLAQTLHQFLAPANREFLVFPLLNQPLDLFLTLLELDPKLFSHLRMICDGGGALRNFRADEIVSAFFTFLTMHPEIDYDGVIFFEESSDKEAETELLLWLKGGETPKVIKGHDVPKALQSMGLQWEKLKLLTMIDPSHRAGANIEQPPGSSILVLLGEDLTHSDAAQTALRGRGVLTGNQRLIWGAERKLLESISKEISPEKVLEWEVCNGVKTADQEVLLSAYQQIDYHIAFPVWDAIKKNRGDPDKQIQLWKKYRKGFVKETEIDLVKRFKGKKDLIASEKILWAYAEERYRSFGFETPWSKATSLHKKITPIITAVSKRQPQLLSSSILDVTRQIYVHTQQKEEMRKEFIADSHIDLEAELSTPLPSCLDINESDFVLHLCNHSKKASKVFNSTGLTDGLWFMEDALNTAKSGGISLKEGFLKPVQYILVIKRQEKWFAFALSDKNASLIQEQMHKMRGEGRMQCALLSAKGKLVQNGKNRSALSQEELQNHFIQDVVIDVNLTRCELIHPLRFMKRVKVWNDFWPMWKKIKQCQPLPSHTHPQQIESLIPAHIKNYLAPQPASSFVDSFFGMFFG